MDLTGVDATLQVLDASGAQLLSLAPTVHAGGWVELLLSDEQTAALAWRQGNWLLDLEFPGGERLRAFTGQAAVYPAGTAPTGSCEGAWVLTAGGQGMPGPMGPAFKVDAFGPLAEREQYDEEEEGFAYLATDNGLLYLREGASGGWTDGVPFQGPAGDDGRSITSAAVNGSGHLIISYSDGTTSDAGAIPPAPTVWGSIGGILLNQNDLANALANKATAEQGELADTAVQPAQLATALGDKVDKLAGYGLSQENFTSAEKSKLAGLESSHFKGVFASLAALESALPTAVAGDYADVDAGVGSDTERYIWDISDEAWVLSGSGAPLTAAQIKELYESNPDTNAYSDAEQAKLAAIEAGATANNNTDELPEGASNLYHTAARVRDVMLTGLSLATNAAITAADSVLSALGRLQAQITAHFGAGGAAHADATTAVAGFMSAADKTKLNGVASGATANDSDASLKNRANHTGSQAISTVTGLQAVLDSKLSAMQWDAVLTPAIASGVLTLDLSGPAWFRVTLTANVTSIVFANYPSDSAPVFALEFVQDGAGGRTVTWPGSVVTDDGGSIQAPATAAGASTIYTLSTVDGTNFRVASGVENGFTVTTGAINEAPAATLASAATVNIGAAASNTVSITGTTTITSFGSGTTSGAIRRVEFQGALTLTHNGTSLILPGAANIATAAGDAAMFRYLGSGNWRCINYQQAAGTAVALSPTSSPTFAALTLTNGQIKFPASQVPSADPNTLDDYEEGTWTPVLTFQTPGDLSVAYSQQTANYTKIGRVCALDFLLQTITFTHTTASGDSRITGLPFSTSGNSASATITFTGITKAGGYTQFAYLVSSTTLFGRAAGSGVSAANIEAGDMPSGTTKLLRGSVVYNVL
ncbi:hypothetical protein D9M70_374690 [compost metagenome]